MTKYRAVFWDLTGGEMKPVTVDLTPPASDAGLLSVLDERALCEGARRLKKKYAERKDVSEVGDSICFWKKYAKSWKEFMSL